MTLRLAVRVPHLPVDLRLPWTQWLACRMRVQRNALRIRSAWPTRRAQALLAMLLRLPLSWQTYLMHKLLPRNKCDQSRHQSQRGAGSIANGLRPQWQKKRQSAKLQSEEKKLEALSSQSPLVRHRASREKRAQKAHKRMAQKQEKRARAARDLRLRLMRQMQQEALERECHGSERAAVTGKLSQR